VRSQPRGQDGHAGGLGLELGVEVVEQPRDDLGVVDIGQADGWLDHRATLRSDR
jgi:hypothetical protein